MTETSDEKDELIAEIVRRTLDRLSDWKPAKLMPGVGPHHPQVHSEFAQKLAEYRDRVGSILALKSVEELRTEYLKDIGSAFNPLTKKHGIHFDLFRQLERLKASRPPWFGMGWSVQGFLLDPKYWMAADTVSLEEAALLMVGVEPRDVRFDALFDGYSQDTRIDDILYFLEDYFELLVRRFGDPDLGPVQIHLGDLCLWVEQSGIEVSNELGDIIKSRKRLVPDVDRKSALDQDKPLHARTREMFQRALLAAAYDRYGLTHKKDVTKVAKKIVAAGDFVGFRLDEKNLAKHLRVAFSHLDEDGEAELSRKKDEK